MDRQTWSRMRLWDPPANVRLVPMYFQSWSSPSTGWSNPLCLLVLVLWRHTQLRLSRTPWHVISKASFSELTDWNKLNFLIFGKVKMDPNLNHYFMFPRADVFFACLLAEPLTNFRLLASLFSQIWLSFWSAEASKAFKFYLKCFKCCIISTELNRTSFTRLGSIEFGDRTQSNSHKKKRTFNRVQLT